MCTKAPHICQLEDYYKLGHIELEGQQEERLWKTMFISGALTSILALVLTSTGINNNDDSLALLCSCCWMTAKKVKALEAGQNIICF